MVPFNKIGDREGANSDGGLIKRKPRQVVRSDTEERFEWKLKP